MKPPTPKKTPKKETPPPSGHEVINSYLNRLTGACGVYRMLDKSGKVLYVGKARNLKKRVTSYAKPRGHSLRIMRMIAKTHSMMFLTTSTETEALLLEQNLIKQLKPRYNVLLRDDKSFPNIMITRDHDFAQITKHRGKKTPKGEYFGPFASAGAVNKTLNQLEKIFLLRTCTDHVFANRTRPCLQHQIARCSAPCVGKISQRDYAASVAEAREFLSGKTIHIQRRLAGEMTRASATQDYEHAARLRDRIRALTAVQSSQGINPAHIKEADVIALYQQGGAACIQVFFIRAHQNWGNRAYFPHTGAGAEAGEILEGFIAQFYDNKTPPRQIIVSEPVSNANLLAEALSQKRGATVSIIRAQRGERAEVTASALRNAREALERKLAESATQKTLLEGIAKTFDLPAPPRRIEVYDNSHIQGAHAVGAMIVAGEDGFMKSAYRKFNIAKTITPGDDLAMMGEVLHRRFARLLKEDPDRAGENWPDLLLIDGGRGQVKATRETLESLGITDIPFVGVAKGVDRNAGREEFHCTGRRAFALPRQDAVLYFIQRLRDEAHRFAIGTHRAARSRAIKQNPLDAISGIGAKRKSALLAHFGSAKAVAQASLKDLKAAEGVSEAMAEQIYDFFHDNV